MSSSLQKIVQAKRDALIRQQSDVPLDVLQETITTLGRPRNFFNAVTRQRKGKSINIIAEIENAPDPVALAKQLESDGASALSVQTDPDSAGRLESIHAVRDAVKLAVMRKDVIVDPYQVYESRAAGADAIMLIAEALETSHLIDLQILATELNMTCVLEVHDIENLIRVRDAVIGFPHRSYSLLAINNRDLETSKTDLGTTLRLAELIEDREVLISVSGINTREDLKKLDAAGVRAVMLGGDDLPAKLHALSG